MKNKLGAAVLLCLLYAQGLLGVAAVAAVLMKEPAKQHAVAQSACCRRPGIGPVSGVLFR